MMDERDLKLIEENIKLIALLHTSDELSVEEREAIKQRIFEIWNELVRGR